MIPIDIVIYDVRIEELYVERDMSKNDMGELLC